MLRSLFALAVAATVFSFAQSPRGTRAAADLLQITSHVAYDIQPDAGPVHVSWDVTFTNNDPSTGPRRDGTIAFYDNAALPVLRGASSLSATSDGRSSLHVAVDASKDGPIAVATVTFSKRSFYGETYHFTMAYDVPQTREHALLVTPYYIYIPAVASGDEATVTINTPPDGVWKTNLQSSECKQDGPTFTCSGSDSVYLAAIAEVSRPDATSSTSFDVGLKANGLAVKLTYFQGEDASAQHLKDLTIAGLPIIEELYGFAYAGPPTLSISQGGQQQILGYEGLTTCSSGASCDVTVSPVVDDVTVLHELAHLWSAIYSKRWLSEGWAQLIAEEAALRLPAGFVQGQVPQRTPASVPLQLDDWGTVTSIIGASEDKLAIQNAGYDRSLRFLYILRQDLGFSVLQQTNATIAQSGQRADSLGYLDVLEETSGKVEDAQFAEWVFPSDFAPTLALRRQARDRLRALEQRAAEEGLSDETPKSIRADVEGHRFDSALAALDKAEAGLAEYDKLKDDLATLKAQASAAGLSVPDVISETAKRWEFAQARDMLNSADKAVQIYSASREKVRGQRSLWERLGLLGRDPDKTLSRSSDAFASGDFQAATERAEAAAEMIDGAAGAALHRLLIVAAALAVFAGGIGGAVWWSRRRENEFVET